MLRTTSAAAASLLAIMIATSASAADLPRKPVAPVFVPPVFTWTGFYVGLNAGYTWSNDNNLTVAASANPIVGNNILNSGAIPRSVGLSRDGFLGGAQIGYNYQFAGTGVVLGVETDIQFADARSSTNVANPLVGSSLNAKAQTNYFGTVRARLGYAVMPQMLLYITGGLAYGEANTTFTGQVATGQTYQFSTSTVRTGWTIGGGIEYALNNNWTVRGEYLFYDLGNNNGTTSCVAGIATCTTFALDKANSGNVIRAAVNYKF
ncbi:MAG: porin family protein [Methylocystis sp.]|nr:porin family protein [Methylocystis sp.]MCA3584277.1 porin family protein [Methylocystis sp.]MCA3588309.1 porin family protein [Methylocystis sp.]MCA3590938.1 porin family protein [Methylocystis sp.]